MFKNQFKNLISKIKIAKINKKEILEIKYIHNYQLIFNFLWNYNYIYGYLIKSFSGDVKNIKYIIFLRYSEKNCSLFRYTTYFDNLCKYKELVNTSFLESNYNHIMLNDKGFFIIKYSLKLKLGGFTFLKI